MQNLMDFGSPESAQYRMICCSHVFIAYWAFLVVDITFTLICIGLECLATFVFEMEHEIWICFHIISAFFWFFGVLGGLEWVRCLTVYTMRMAIIIFVSCFRLIGSLDKFQNTTSVKDVVFLILPLPIFTYFIGIVVAFRMCSFASNRYRGYYDVDDELRFELNKKLHEIDLKED